MAQATGRWKIVLLAGVAAVGVLVSAAWPEFRTHPTWSELAAPFRP
jgi:hypothetical protein